MKIKSTWLFIWAAVVAISALSVGASAQVWRWSQTAGNNANSDPHIDWHIGMAPSSVGSSSRAEMAEIAKYRDDISGLLTTGGTSTAFTVSTNQGLCTSSTTPQDGQTLSVTMNATNGASATFQADGCTAYPIQSSSGTAVASGTLVSGSPYKLKFSVSNSAWMLFDFYGSTLNVPLGGLVPYTGSTVPSSNFVFPAGQCLSTTTYAAYWALLGSPASGGCPGGQFAVIDMRGRVPAALDNLNGSSANRLTAAFNGCGVAMTAVGAACSTGSESKTLSTANLPPYTPSGSVTTNLFDNGHTLLVNGGGTSLGQGGGGAFGTNGWQNTPTIINGNIVAGVSSSFAGSAQGGVSQAFPSLQPTIGVTYLLRVL
ncbi:hypothetical protein ACVIIW_006249 [Bradyrhizobium sp. USDA 4449]